MLYFAGTDWFLLSWRLLPLPTPHMVESARSSSTVFLFACVCVCEKSTKYVRLHARTNGAGGDGGTKTKGDNLKRNPASVTQNMCVCVCVERNARPSVCFSHKTMC